MEFHREVIEKIRRIDPDHMFSVEGHHWASDPSSVERFDENMVLHFHYYANLPQRSGLDKFIAKGKELGIPLWLGETGENLNLWYAALYPLASSLQIGFNIWPWKKMACTNSPCSIKKPKDYDLILEYLHGGPHPGFEKSQAILNEYLENIRLENCELHPEVTNHIFRKPPFTMMAADFDELPGKGVSWQSGDRSTPDERYRTDTGMTVVRVQELEKRFPFDCGIDQYALRLHAGEFSVYTLQGSGKVTLSISYEAEAVSRLGVSVNGGEEMILNLEAGNGKAVAELDASAGEQKVKLHCLAGTIDLTTLAFS